MIRNSSLFLLLVSLILTSCKSQPQTTPTETVAPTPSQTPLPSATPTLSPTPTPSLTPAPTNTPKLSHTPRPTRTSTPTISPDIWFGDVQIVKKGGFSFQPLNPIYGYVFEIQESQVEGMAMMKDEAQKVFVFFYGTKSDGIEQDLSEEIEAYLKEVAENLSGEFKQSLPTPIRVDNIEGISVELIGVLSDQPIQGQIVAVQPTKTDQFFALGFALLSGDRKLWEDKADSLFHGLLGTVTFTNLPIGDEVCPVSEDPTYGYSRENPIQVGGGAFNGPPREEAYLDNLLGPDGQEITYNRSGSIPFGDTILDVFKITYPGETSQITLYIDEYAYAELSAPVGLTCLTTFPLSEP